MPRPPLADWLDFAADTLHNFATVVDWVTVGSLLAELLHAPTAGRYSWRPQSAGRVTAFEQVPDPQLGDIAARASEFHPLARHYTQTGSTAVTAIHQVAAADKAVEVCEYLEELAAHGIEQHVWIPVPALGQALEVFGACRSGEQFSAKEQADASSVQRLLIAMVAHASAVSQWCVPAGADESAQDCADQPRLTAREVIVLNLGARGMTSAAIARALAISGRTVEKHFEHAYRKLGVRDRISALQRARDQGVLPRRQRVRADP